MTISTRRINGDSGMLKIPFRLPDACYSIFDFCGLDCGEQSFGKRIFMKSPTLGMPLYTDHEFSVNVFNCFDNPIRRLRYPPEVRAKICNGLVMKTIHLKRLCPGQPSQNAVGAHSHRMPRRLLRFTMVVVKDWRGNDRDVLNQSAASKTLRLCAPKQSPSTGRLARSE